MYQRIVFGALFAASLGLSGLAAPAARAEEKDHAHEHMMKCAKACLDCQKDCDSCFHHCAHLLADGKKDHAKTMHLCVDCAELCSTAGKLSARNSPLAVTACEACAKACDQCAAACEKFPDDAHMKMCAKSCRDCAKECREMVKHVVPEEKK
jgi:hypothetical protein